MPARPPQAPPNNRQHRRFAHALSSLYYVSSEIGPPPRAVSFPRPRRAPSRWSLGGGAAVQDRRPAEMSRGRVPRPMRRRQRMQAPMRCRRLNRPSDCPKPPPGRLLRQAPQTAQVGKSSVWGCAPRDGWSLWCDRADVLPFLGGITQMSKHSRRGLASRGRERRTGVISAGTQISGRRFACAPAATKGDR